MEYQNEVEEILAILGLPEQGKIVPQTLMEEIDAVLSGVAEHAAEAAIESYRPVGG